MAASLFSVNISQLRATLSDTLAAYAAGKTQLYATLANGTAINQADVMYSASLLINTAGSTVLTLNDGSLKQPNGSAATFAKMKGIWIINRDVEANAANIITIGAGSNPWMPAVTVGGPGAEFKQFSPTLLGLATIDGTHKTLQIAAAAGAAVPVDVLLVGTSA